MEVISATYAIEAERQRKAKATAYGDFYDIDINEPYQAGHIHRLVIRFRSQPSDLLFFDQLRSAIEQVGKFLRP